MGDATMTKLEERNEDAWAAITDMCTGSRRWRMTVPVDIKRDHDVRVTLALRDGKDLLKLVQDGIEAMRLTHEYFGDSLPEIDGWAWFDWTKRAKAFIAEEHVLEGTCWCDPDVIHVLPKEMG